MAMPRARLKSKANDDHRTDSEICDDLEKLTRKKLQGREVETVRAAIERLTRFGDLVVELTLLNLDLAKIDKVHEVEEANDPYEKGKIELVASALALKEVYSFLSVRAPSHSLTLLLNALGELVSGGSPAAMFAPLNDLNNRPPDTPSVMSVKGALAGIMHIQQSAGMSREQAAHFIVRNISPNLVARISRKPISARSVEEWLDRYGGDFAANNAGRKSYLTWNQGEAAGAAKFRDITERMAKELPARKPK
jgi:hypothetical protein